MDAIDPESHWSGLERRFLDRYTGTFVSQQNDIWWFGNIVVIPLRLSVTRIEAIFVTTGWSDDQRELSSQTASEPNIPALAARV